MDLRPFVRDLSDFPRPGMAFWDITPLLADVRAFQQAVSQMQAPVEPLQATHVLALESRGFIFGSALALRLNLGFVPARKPGRLPGPTLRATYLNTQGVEDALEIPEEAFKSGDRVLIVDDVLATGGTAAAARQLVERTGATALALTLFAEVGNLPGREALAGLPVFSVLRV